MFVLQNLIFRNVLANLLPPQIRLKRLIALCILIHLAEIPFVPKHQQVLKEIQRKLIMINIHAGCYKSSTELELYLDIIKLATVTPLFSFDLPMYMKMVVETYN